MKTNQTEINKNVDSFKKKKKVTKMINSKT